MALTLVTGPANAGKAGRVLDALRARLDEAPLLVVPSWEDVEHSRRELAEGGAVLGARVVRFARLFEIVAERAGPEAASARIASPVQRGLLAAAAARDAPPRGPLGVAARRSGFAAATVRFAAELERATIEPDRLAAALRRWAGGGPRREYAEDVAALYAAYRRRLEHAGLVDPELFAWRALDALRREPARWGRTPVFAYGFDDLTPLELDALETLAERVGVDVTVSVPHERGRAAFRATAPLLTELLERTGGRVEELAASSAHYHPEARAELHGLERGLFETDGAEPLGAGGAVRLLEAGGERGELELVAREVAAELARGTDPGDIAVVLRDPGRAAPLIASVFAAADIPYTLDRRVALAHTALGRGLLALVRLAGPEGDETDVVTYLRTPGLVREPALVDRFEAGLRRDGVRGASAARARWEADGWPLEEIDRLAGATRARAWLRLVAAEAERLFARPRRRAAAVLDLDELEDARALAAVRAAAADLAELVGEDPSDRELAIAALTGLEVHLPGPSGAGRVRVAAPEAIRARRFTAVFVCGLVEGEFPRGRREEPFLPDDVRREVNRAGGLRLPRRVDELDRERFLFYVCASRAARSFVLSRRTGDETGRPTAASFLLDDVRARYLPGALDPFARRGQPREPTGPAAPAAPPLAAPPERLRHPDLLAELGGRREFSPGALEAYAACPVRWLVERVLRPSALEPDAEPLARGSLAHDVLRATLERLRGSEGSARLTPERLPNAERVLRAVLAEHGEAAALSASPARRRAALTRLEFDLLRLLRAEAESGSHFEPERLELSFGLGDEGEGALPALELEPEGVRLRGRIDRLDVLDGRAVVRDYKAGATAVAEADWAEEDRLQVPLYLLAVRELLGLEPGAGLYVALGGQSPGSRGLVSTAAADDLGDEPHAADLRDPGEVDAVLARARARAGELVAGIGSGAVRPCPERCSRNGCAHPSICRPGTP